MALISVIIPAYRHVEYLAAAVESVLSQRNVQFELLVVDDGSPEDVKAALEPYLADPRVLLHRLENGGVSNARNFGVRVARGEFVAFLDHDDQWHPDKLESQIRAFAENPSAVLCHGDVDYIDSSGGVLPHAINFPAPASGLCLGQMLMGNPIVTSTVLLRRVDFERLGGFRASLHHAEDYDLWLRLAIGRELLYIDGPIAKYRVHGDSATRNTEAMLSSTLVVLTRFLRDYPEVESAFPSRSRRLRFARLHCGLSRYHFSRRKWIPFAKHWATGWFYDRTETKSMGLPQPVQDRLRWYISKAGWR